MEIKKILSENPIQTQWLQLSYFTYPSNIDRYISENKFNKIDLTTKEHISGCIRQAEAYYSSARSSKIDILPLLIYYGTVDLFSSAWALRFGEIPKINDHGMRLSNFTNRIADIVITPNNPQNGALKLFTDLFSPGLNIVNGYSFTFEEILSCIPDIRLDFLNSYIDAKPHTVPLETVRKSKLFFDRADKNDLSRFEDIGSAFFSIDGYKSSYLNPSITKSHVILYRKLEGTEIGCFSLSGKKFLIIPLQKNHQLISLHQAISYFIGLYPLSYLTRYHPEIWNPFITVDNSGEKLLIEQFLINAIRIIPNLVLNLIMQTNIQYLFHNEQTINLSESPDKDEIEDMIKESMNQRK